jgi:hypothetical protein
MPAVRHALVGLLVAFTVVLAAALIARTTSPSDPEPTNDDRAPTLSIPFVQTATADGDAFVAATFAATVRVTPLGAVEYVLPCGTVLRESGAAAVPRGGSPSPTRVNVFRGKDPDGWERGLPTFREVVVEGVAQGVDLEIAAGARNVEKRFHVAPGADENAIRMTFEGAEELTVRGDGRLDVRSQLGAMTFTAPIAYEETADGCREVPVRYVVDGDTYGFQTEGRDSALGLVIDPLIGGTYIGGWTEGDNFLNDHARAVAAHGGSVYLVGTTQADIFPNDYEGTSGYDRTYGGGWSDAFVCRLSSDLTALEAVTFLGGDGHDEGQGMTADARGVWVVGSTRSTDFPVTPGAYQTQQGSPVEDGFVTHLSADLENLVASTFIGGESFDNARSVVIEKQGRIVVAGQARSQETGAFVPELAQPFQRVNHGVDDVFVVRFSPDLTQVEAGTMYGGRFGETLGAVALMDGDVVICGTTSSSDIPLSTTAFDTELVNESDGFVARFDADLGQLVAATFVGGEDSEYPTDSCHDVLVDGNVIVVCGSTSSRDFPTTPGAFQTTIGGPDGTFPRSDAFVVRLSDDLSTLVAGTFVGGSGSESARGMTLHDEGVVIVGQAASLDLPLPPGSEDATLGGSSDGYVFVLSPDLSTAESGRYVGGTGFDDANDVTLVDGVAYVAGNTSSEEFDELNDNDGFDTTFNDTLTRSDAYLVAIELFEGGGTPPPTEIDAYILPKRLDVKHNAKKPEKSWLNSGGWFDTGSGDVDWTKPGSLWIGERKFDIPGLSQQRKSKQWWEWREGDMYFRIKPSRYGSSKGKFKLKWKHADVLDIPTDQPLVVRFQNGDVDALGEVTLKDGRYQHGRQRGALVRPALALYSCRTILKGNDKDSIRARLGLRTEGGIPHECPPLTIGLDDQFTDSLDTDAFDQKKRKFVFKGPKGGISKATVDFGKEKLAIVGKKIDVGQFPEGPQAVAVLVQLGDEALVLHVRMVRDGKRMRY